EHPFALELVYRRDLSRDTLVQSSVDEMQRLGANDEGLLTRWAGEMRKAFVDVRAGQRITGIYLPGQGCRFYVDGAFRHAVADSGFARAFFSIWLDRRTRNPELRRELLGLNGVDEP
ncbi:TPA: chalcone isomerase family protein, partial [Pseudomonas aeruginosa]|nr:chalcone isomerase family protein [Pseudomonas aeruginosa]